MPLEFRKRNAVTPEYYGLDKMEPRRPVVHRVVIVSSLVHSTPYTVKPLRVFISERGNIVGWGKGKGRGYAAFH